MKKNNRGGNNNQNNYFTRNIKDKGNDFVYMKTAKDLEYDAPTVFRDIAKGRVDINKFGGYFLCPQFMESMLKVAHEKYMYHIISFNGVNMMITEYMNKGQMVDKVVIEVNENHKRLSEAYSIIYQTLMYVRTTQDITNLYILPSQLSIYKFLI